MNAILSHSYNLVFAISLIVLTMLTWPILLLLQNPLTREWSYAHIFKVLYKINVKKRDVICEQPLIAPKRKLFASMNQYFEEISPSGSGKVIKVLEIGPGTGTNFKYYKAAIQLTTIDINPFLREDAQRLSVEYPLVHIVDSLAVNAENMTCFEDNSFDVVCGTQLMCCIKNNKAALNEIHRVLKPHGRYYYFEGNRMQPNRFFLNRFLQGIFAIFWIVIAYGCKFMHNTFDENLRSSKLVVEWNQIFRIPGCLIGPETHYGFASKI